MTKPWDLTSEHLLPELAPQVLGAVARRFRDFSSAEDAVQEAMNGTIPGNPAERRAT
jgi:predicted RNA polymerase sigma factor